MNAILSAKSDPQILIDQEDNGGLRNYFLCVFSLFYRTSVPPWLIDRLCAVSDRFNSGQNAWVSMRVHIKLSTLGMVTVLVCRHVLSDSLDSEHWNLLVFQRTKPR